MTENIPQKLATALVAAQKDARAVALDGDNKHHGYRYAKAESIIDEGRITLSANGLAVVQTSWSLTLQGNDIPHVSVDYLVLHDSGECMALSMSTPAIEGKGRPIDKAACAALTTNLAYVIRGLLLLPRDDDAAAIDQRDDRTYEPTPHADYVRGQLDKLQAPTDQPPAKPADPEAEEAKTFAALIRECGRTGDLAELERLPAKIKASNFRKDLYQQLVVVYNEVATELRSKKAEAA
ncbi:MAG: ERF family protein [Gemmatimonadaceae bacterium]|jgi:hypothetical protein